MLLERGIYTDSRANCSRRLLTVHAATTNCFIIFPRLNYLFEVSGTVHEKIIYIQHLECISYHHALPFAWAACAAFTPIHVFSIRPSSLDMSELQSFMTSSAVRACRKLMMPAGRSTRAHTDFETTSRLSVSSVSRGVRSRRSVRRARVMRV